MTEICRFCGKGGKRVYFKNHNEIMFMHIEANQSAHVECYIEEIIDKILGKREEELMIKKRQITYD